MFLQFYETEAGERVYTLKGYTHKLIQGFHEQEKLKPDGQPTSSAHPARFSPDDKFSRNRVLLKKRFGLLLTQQPRPIL